MSSWTLTAVMDGVAKAITDAAVTNLRNVYAYPVLSVDVPCAVVGYPTKITFDMTYQQGGNELELPVWFVVGQTSTKSARDRLSVVLANAAGIKAAVDGVHSWGVVRAASAQVTTITIDGVEYLAAEITLEITA